MITHFKVVTLLTLMLIVLSCFNKGEIAPSDIEHDNQIDILTQFSRNDPVHFKSMSVYGTNPSGTKLCFRSSNGETFIYDLKSKKTERVEHAMFIGPKEVTEITYSSAVLGGAFILWAGKRKLLSIGVGE